MAVLNCLEPRALAQSFPPKYLYYIELKVKEINPILERIKLPPHFIYLFSGAGHDGEIKRKNALDRPWPGALAPGPTHAPFSLYLFYILSW